jgi:glycosyltransferase involved in cell wall biosynthesis
MKVSILIAVYNGENFIKDALDSLVSQTYRDFEILVCNDGSTDATLTILTQYQTLHNIKIIDLPHHGMVHAFNQAYASSTGDVICFLAHDDVLLPDSLQERISVISKGAGAVYCNGYVCDSELRIISKIFSKNHSMSWKKDKHLICRNNPIPGALMMIRKEVAKKIFPIPDTLAFEDWWAVLNTLYYAGEIIYIDKPLFLYRTHTKNDSGWQSEKNFDISLKKDWTRHGDYYEVLFNLVSNWDLPLPEKKYLQEVILTNKHVVEKTLKNQFSLPTYTILKDLGIVKYLYSQAVILNKGYIVYKCSNIIKKILL